VRGAGCEVVLSVYFGVIPNENFVTFAMGVMVGTWRVVEGEEVREWSEVEDLVGMRKIFDLEAHQPPNAGACMVIFRISCIQDA